MNDVMTQVYQYGFAVSDILLYLDTHPEDQEALTYYKNMREARDAAVSATRGTRRNAGETRRKGKPLETVGPQSYGN